MTKEELMEEVSIYEEKVLEHQKKVYNTEFARHITEEQEQLKGDIEVEGQYKEIKYDKLLETTGNVYIEVWERGKDKKWYPSSICREARETGYIIGNETYYFETTVGDVQDLLLDNWNNKKCKWFRKVKTETSIGVVVKENEFMSRTYSMMRIL